MFYILNSRTELNRRGYSQWDTSEARMLLKKNVENKLHKKMTIQELQQKKKPFTEIPLKGVC